MTEKRTLLGWFEYLDTPGRELTLAEFMAVMVMNTREYSRLALESARHQKDAAEHLEGMIGTLDETLATTHPVYSALAQKRGQPVPVLPGMEHDREGR